MVLSRDAHRSPVDWYFARAGAPVLTRHNRMSSLVYLMPTIPPGALGEVAGVRSWRSGEAPDYIGDPSSSFSTAGLASWWLDGVPPPYQPIDLAWTGRKGFPYVPQGGIFPPLSPLSLPPTMTDPSGIVHVGVWNGDAWHWAYVGGSPPHSIDVWWGPPSGFVPFGFQSHCQPGVATIWAQSVVTGGILQCANYVSPTSVWIDPSGRTISAGSHLTVRGV